MDLDDTPEEAAFRAEARTWLEANAERRALGDKPLGIAEREDPRFIQQAQDWQAKKADAGWACLNWPTKYGGRGASSIQKVIWGQEQARFRTPADLFTAGIGMAGPTLMVHGSEEQRERFLPPMARGDEIWCQLFSEPAAGSDLASLRTRAEPDGTDWIVNGQKIWSSVAQHARWGILVTRTNFDVPKHKGLTYFVLDMQADGIDVRPIRQISGSSHFNEVFLNDVRIPDANRVGKVDGGWAVTITTLMNERSSLGSGEGGGFINIDNLIALAREARDERGSLLDSAGIREQIADYYVRTSGLKYAGYRTLTAISRGDTPGPEGSMGKLVTSNVRQRMTSLGLELQGATGALLDGDATAQRNAWQLGYLGAPGVRVAGGTDEIMRNIIAERVLGLPPEPRVDKGIPFREIPSGSD